LWKKIQLRLPRRLVFIDETWAKTNMTRTHGWNRRGEALIAKAPQGHWKTMTFLVALRCDEITAPFVLDGPINGESFLAYVEQVLAPTLKHGDIVVMDNLGSHKSAAINKAIRASGARRFFLPQYSPDLNPIEQVFAKFKKLLRKAEERTPDGVWRRIGALLEFLSNRMRKLLPKLRIRFSLKRKDSRSAMSDAPIGTGSSSPPLAGQEPGKNQTIEIEASRFGDFLRSTLSWWRSVRISASSEILDRNSPITAHQISLNISPMGRSIARFAASR
jgi:transposase